MNLTLITAGKLFLSKGVLLNCVCVKNGMNIPTLGKRVRLVPDCFLTILFCFLGKDNIDITAEQVKQKVMLSLR